MQDSDFPGSGLGEDGGTVEAVNPLTGWITARNEKQGTFTLTKPTGEVWTKWKDDIGKHTTVKVNGHLIFEMDVFDKPVSMEVDTAHGKLKMSCVISTSNSYDSDGRLKMFGHGFAEQSASATPRAILDAADGALELTPESVSTKILDGKVTETTFVVGVLSGIKVRCGDTDRELSGFEIVTVCRAKEGSNRLQATFKGPGGKTDCVVLGQSV